MQELQKTRVQYLGWQDPLEKEMGTHSSILAWKIPWIEEPGGPQSAGSRELDMTDVTERGHTSCRMNKAKTLALKGTSLILYFFLLQDLGKH